MTSPALRSMLDSTSAAGPMAMGAAPGPVLVGVLLAGLGTAAAHVPVGVVPACAPEPIGAATGGISVATRAHAGAAIAELRRLSGFTWDQLARLFHVSRRALHFWASGRAMTASHEEHLQRLLAVVRRIDRGSAAANRAALLAAQEDGAIPRDLLAARHYEQVVALLGRGGAGRAPAPERSAEALAARAPRPPEELVAALQDRVHSETGRARAARSVKVRRDR